MIDPSIDITRDELISMLKKGIVELEFRKGNGDMRLMRCTHNADHMPESAISDDRQSTNHDPDKVNVWDIQAQGWRSFKISSLTREPIPITRAEASAEYAGQPEHHGHEETAELATNEEQ